MSRGMQIERHEALIRSGGTVIKSGETLLDRHETVTGTHGRLPGRVGMIRWTPVTLRADSGDCAKAAKPGAERAAGWSAAAERGADHAQSVASTPVPAGKPA